MIFPKSHSKERDVFLIILFTTLVYLFLVQGYPLLWSVYISLTNQRIGTEGRFVGFRNYLELFSSSSFWEIMGFTLIYVGSTIVLKLFWGMIMALALNQPLKGRNLYRALLFLPWALPTLTSVLAWRWMLGDVGGIVNYGLLQLSLIDRPLGWLADPTLARFSVILVNVWRGAPFFGISILSALQAIPDYLYEAALIDGASSWQSFRHITLPSIQNVVALVTLVSTIWTLADFEVIWIMTRGGPANSTHVFSTFSYLTAFRNLDLSKGVAISLFMVPFSLLLMILTLRFIFREEGGK
ncbi:MAG: sugar ABC transporter permease [Candidatus Atribacteria bacterium]|nr:sugar ABC transporter permease [Candidatus Atribacteria bacterium]